VFGLLYDIVLSCGY